MTDIRHTTYRQHISREISIEHPCVGLASLAQLTKQGAGMTILFLLVTGVCQSLNELGVASVIKKWSGQNRTSRTACYGPELAMEMDEKRKATLEKVVATTQLRLALGTVVERRAKNGLDLVWI